MSATSQAAIKKLKSKLKQIAEREKTLGHELSKDSKAIEKKLSSLKAKLQREIDKYHDTQLKLVSEMYKLSPETVDYAQDLHDEVIELCKQYPMFLGQLAKDGFINSDQTQEAAEQDQEEQIFDEGIDDEDAQEDIEDNEAEQDLTDEEQEEDPDQTEEAAFSDAAGESDEAEVPVEPLEPLASVASVAESQEETNPDVPTEETAYPATSEPDANTPAEEPAIQESNLDNAGPEATLENTDQSEQLNSQDQSEAADEVAQSPEPRNATDETPQINAATEQSALSEEEENNMLDKVYDQSQLKLVSREAVHSIDSASKTIAPEDFEFAKSLDRVKVQSEINYAAEDLKSESASVAKEYQDVIERAINELHDTLFENAKDTNKLVGPTDIEVTQKLKNILLDMGEEADDLTMDLLNSATKTEFRIQSEAIQAITLSLQTGLSQQEIIEKLSTSNKSNSNVITNLVEKTAEILGIATNN